jgi:hypothetical protein
MEERLMRQGKHAGKRSAATEAAERLALVRGMIEAFDKKLRTDVKATVADFVRLLSLERELSGGENINEVRVQWVQPLETESSK